MKLRKRFIFATMLFGLSLAACNQTLPRITGYTIDENNNIVVIYDNGNTEIIGNLTDEDVGDHVTSVTISEDGYYVINGVKTSIKATEVYTVKFVTGYSATIQDQKVFEGHKVEKPQLDRTGYSLVGWFCNDEEWRFNSDVVLNDMTLTAQWTANQYSVSFVNEKGTNPDDMNVTYDSQVTLPTVSSVEGYTFCGWYNGATKVSDGAWKIADNVTLTAKWNANTYTVTLDANGGIVSPLSKQVTYGQNYTLPVPTNSFGAFKGWYYGETKLTNENGDSLAPWAYTKNITATTNWIEEINSLSQFKSIASSLNGHYKLMVDIDLSGEDWIPFGNASNPFTGKFDGNNHIISGLSITTQRAYEGLFGYNQGTINNVKLTGVNLNIAAISQNSYVGGIAGYNEGAISNSEVSGTITTNPHVSSYESCTGGIAGFNHSNGTITDTTNNANINGINYVGGIVASNEGTLSDLTNNGSVNSATYGGGIVALSNTGLTNCINNGNVTSASYTAGIVAALPYSTVATISNCKNTGEINTQSSAGGIVGYNMSDYSSVYLTITNCANLGNINSSTDSSYIGGIAGFINSTYISDSYSVANITGADYAGGIIGRGWDGNVTNCYAVGKLQSRSRVGGISGIFQNAKFNECYTNTVIKGNITGTINGSDLSGSDMSNCYYSGSNQYAVSYLEQGTQTTVRYDQEFYVNSLFWSTNTWSFSGTTYPTLVWETNML